MALMGCRESVYRQPVTFEDTTTAVQVDRFGLAIDLLENFEEYDHQQGPAELLKRLNRWVNEVPRKIEVVRDPLFESAAAEFAEVKQKAHLRSLTFITVFVFHLTEVSSNKFNQRTAGRAAGGWVASSRAGAARTRR